jgi:hypothetical protein
MVAVVAVAVVGAEAAEAAMVLRQCEWCRRSHLKGDQYSRKT